MRNAETLHPVGRDRKPVQARGPSFKAEHRFSGDADLRLVENMVREVCGRLNADAITIAFREGDGERLLVCTREGDVRMAEGSISLGLISRGPTRLKGGAGLLQAVECCALFGFVPCSYLGVPFKETGQNVRGGVAAWSRRPRRWGATDGTLVRQLASYCLDRI